MPNSTAASVHNVGILGHGGTGKTSLIERILYAAGKTSRLGKIEDGTTVCDYLDQERERKQTICLKLAHVSWNGSLVHLVDHPGYADFIGEVAASTPLLDGAIIVVDASAGIQVGTDNAVKYTDQYHVPHAFFINKLDKDHTDFAATVDAIRATYGNQCVPLVIPIGKGEGLQSVVNILTGDTSSLSHELDALKIAMSDAVAEADDDLLAKYLETGVLTADEFTEGLHKGIESGKIVPIIAGSVSKGLGLNELMEVVVNSFPTPFERHVKVLNGTDVPQDYPVTTDGPFIAQVFRSIVDPYVGHLTLFRVISGTLKTDTEIYNITRDSKERTGKLFMMCGKDQTAVESVGPGDLAALTKLKNTHFGDTLVTPGTNIRMPEIHLPESMVKLASYPKSRADEDKIGEALNRLAEEDPTFKHYRDPATGEHVVKGMGDLQLDILLDRMKKKFHIEAETRVPKVAYKETIKGKADVQGKHKKQSGGHGQYGDVHLRISPNERGAGYKFVDSIVGGVVPRQYIPAVEKGSHEALEHGVIAGFPVVDVVVELHFGSYHDVDSSEVAFKIAAAMAIQKGVKEARPCILEPVVELEVTIPEDYMGDINGDLNSRRGRILGMEQAGPGRQCIRALVPEAEVLRYSTDLRSKTGGRGSYSIKFSHYDELPEHLAQGLIAAYEKARAEGH